MIAQLQNAPHAVLTSPAFWVVAALAASATAIQLRGRVRLKLQRQIFDHSETYVHTAENRTNDTRVILLCDIERPLSNRFVRRFNRTIGHGLVRADASPNQVGDREGVLGTISKYVHLVQSYGRRVNAWHYPTYWVLKKLILVGGLYRIFF